MGMAHTTGNIAGRKILSIFPNWLCECLAHERKTTHSGQGPKNGCMNEDWTCMLIDTFVVTITWIGQNPWSRFFVLDIISTKGNYKNRRRKQRIILPIGKGHTFSQTIKDSQSGDRGNQETTFKSKKLKQFNNITLCMLEVKWHTGRKCAWHWKTRCRLWKM